MCWQLKMVLAFFVFGALNASVSNFTPSICVQETERANRLDDTSMNDRERALNRKLLDAATGIVGQPKQLSVRLF